MAPRVRTKPWSATKIAIYLLTPVALVSCIYLICGCIPTISGRPSFLNDVYAIRIHMLGSSVHELSVGVLALCVEHQGFTSCAMTTGKTPSDLLAPLYRFDQRPLVNIQLLETALRLQQEVFFVTPILATLFLTCALVCMLSSDCLGKPSRVVAKVLAAVWVALATIVMLVGALYLEGFKAFQIVNPAVEVKYEVGISYVSLHWFGCSFGVMAFGMLVLCVIGDMGGFRRWGCDDADEHEMGVRDPMLPRGESEEEP